MNGRLSMWVGGSLAAVVAIFAAAYFLLIGPVMDSTAATDEQREQVQAQNVTLRNQNTVLEGQFNHINDLRLELKDLHEQIPNRPSWDSFTTMVGNMSNDNGVVITSITGGAATAVGGVAAPVPADEDGAAAGAGAPVAAASGMALPVTIAFQGSYGAALATIGDLQQVDQRLMLIQTVEIRGLEPNESSVPPVAPGDVGVVINGFIFLQPPVAPVPNQKAPEQIDDGWFVPSS
ncbi:MAG: hypothetical protein FWD11_03530 [Micrococcales bacterium]|nr:hypothetical protein [Micrococcales bacterium]